MRSFAGSGVSFSQAVLFSATSPLDSKTGIADTPRMIPRSLSLLPIFAVALAMTIAFGCNPSSTPAGALAPTPTGQPPVAEPQDNEPPAPSIDLAAHCHASAEPTTEMPFVVLEVIGGISLEATEEQVRAAFGEPASISVPTANAVAGGLDTSWLYPDRGLTLTFWRMDQQSAPSVSIMELRGSSSEKTIFGIGIGSTVAEVESAYADCLNREDGNAEMLVAGSVYGGVMFEIEAGVVKSIFVGAGAE